MSKLNCFHLSAAALVFATLIAVEARSAELEGALQYSPPSIGEDAQPPSPARMVPQARITAAHPIARQRV